LFDWSVRAPLHRFPLLDSKSADTVRDVLGRSFGARAFDLCHNEGEFRTVVNYIPFGSLDLTFSGCTAAARVRLPEVDMVRQRFVLSGNGEATFGNTSENDAAKAVVVPAGAEATYQNGEHLAQHILRIDASALRTKLGAMLGAPISEPIEFPQAAALDHPEQARLRRLISHMVAELDVATIEVPEQALAQYEQSLMVCFLYASRHTYSDALERSQPRLAHWQLRRAEDHIEGNSSLPLTLEALAAVTDTSGLAVADAFRATRGVSPLAFLQRVRLNYARRALRAPEERTTVAGVARRFGFSNTARFGRDYRRAFSESPSATLAEARRKHS
jgi:AraC-like DNA-binding protein